jgi:hypothetical protein
MSLLGDMSYNFGSVSSEFAIFSLLEFVCYLVLSLSFTQLYIFLLLGSSKCSEEAINSLILGSDVDALLPHCV